MATKKQAHQNTEAEHRQKVDRMFTGPGDTESFSTLEVPREMNDPSAHRHLALLHLIYSICGLLLGLACIIGGILLFLHGVTGSTNWTANILGAESTITDAAPGAVLFVVGIFLVLITRYTTRVK